MHCSVAVILPCYKSKDHVLGVIAGIGAVATHIIVVDDACPLGTGDHVAQQCADPRATFIRHEENQGVGGAVMSGYAKALELGADIMVKIDSDGQMDPALIPTLIAPILRGLADYTKGNRFFNPEDVGTMPPIRLAGNIGLSFMTKLSSGYWSLFDPTNGFTAIHRAALELLPLTKVNRRYFFETDMLFRLYTIRAVVIDVPMRAFYGEEESNLNVMRTLPEFAYRHLKTLFKRIFYMYFLRDFSAASIELVLGTLLIVFGFTYGAASWLQSIESGYAATAGTVMASALPIILGVQLWIAFLTHDYQSIPRIPLLQLRENRLLPIFNHTPPQ